MLINVTNVGSNDTTICYISPMRGSRGYAGGLDPHPVKSQKCRVSQ